MIKVKNKISTDVNLIMNVCIIINAEKKGLLFLETSALDSTNVEAAFTTVLAGNIYIYLFLYC